MLENLLEKIAGVRVLVVGDMMLDHYIWGDVHRISPEAPVPVVHAERDTYTTGGAANVALNLANLHTHTSLIGYYGKDEAGGKLLSMLAQNHINVLDTVASESVPTIIKTRVIVRNQQLCRIDREAKQALYNIEGTQGFNEALTGMLEKADAVIISDYAKGVITQSLIDTILQYAQNHPQLLVALDPKPSRQLNFKGVSLLTPNRSEALLLAGIAEPYPGTPYPLQEVAARIHERYEPKQLVITLGADGMAICNEGEVVQHLPTQAKEVFDVSGAGDTVIATLTAALATGADVVSAARLANIAAACVVSHVGTVPIQYEELEGKTKEGMV